jgi:diguanylate cyclase (GGDEF)-like protein
MNPRKGPPGHAEARDHAEDRYAAQRETGFPWLRFAPDLEREYRDSFAGMNMTRIRLAGTVALLSVFGFIFVDTVLGMDLESTASDLLLMAFCLPAAGVPLFATYIERARPHLLRLIQLGVIGVSAGVLAVIIVGRTEHEWFPYESLLLVTAYTYFVTGLMLYQAMFCGLLLWAGFVLSNWTLQSHAVLLYEAYYLLVANGVGCIGLYLLDRQQRTEFLLRHELRLRAARDSLTGLLNHRAFNAHLETAWLQAQRELDSIGLLLVDLDDFKRVNDTAGHMFGDGALRQVAQALKACALRPLDAAGRYGGDELIAVWFGVNERFLTSLAEELPRRIAAVQGAGPAAPVTVTISGGAVLAWPRPGLTMAQAIKVADDVLYERKRNARGTIGFKVLGAPASDREKTAA